MAYNQDALTKLSALENLAAKIKTELLGKATKATTLAGYGIEDAYTKEQLDAKIGAVYKPAGSVAFADIPPADAEHIGMVYNVTNEFTTTENFVEGAGKQYPAGTNVVVVENDTGYQYDVLSGFVDLSNYATKSELTTVEPSATVGYIKINGTETKLFDVATNEDVAEMLNTVFPSSGEV